MDITFVPPIPPDEGKTMELFFIEYSDSHLVERGDFILDDIEMKTTCEEIENYLNNTIYTKYHSDIDRIEAIDSMSYRIKGRGKLPHENFIRKVWREYQLNLLSL
jgi:hypothetical protein